MRKRILVLLLLVFTLSACSVGGVSKRNLCRAWYERGYSSPAFVLYDDGTCEIDGEYGGCTWSLVNGNILKLSNYYGESETGRVDRVTSSELHLSGGGSSSVFYSSPRQ